VSIHFRPRSFVRYRAQELGMILPARICQKNACSLNSRRSLRQARHPKAGMRPDPQDVIDWLLKERR
jgi:hypothetical protein